ncbi:hypothetical protein [Kutzneria kofuensis]|uniref:hypothetical protein n=1 Tax=Kutzneria kofuensis TaxID=103725 RepID=UPI0031E95C77
MLKSNASLTDEQLDRAVAREMLQLSVVAFAMFNRNQQGSPSRNWTTIFQELVAEPTAAELLVGRFYFVYVAQATHDRKLLKTYEFLHATFGEFLVARLVVQELENLAATAAVPSPPGRPQSIDDRFLHAVLSFAPLTMRLTVVEFIETMIDNRPDAAQITDLLLDLFHTALQPRHLPALDYRPAGMSVPARAATYSANLFVLASLAAGELTHTPGSSRTPPITPSSGRAPRSCGDRSCRPRAGRPWSPRSRPSGSGTATGASCALFPAATSPGRTIDPNWTYNGRRRNGGTRSASCTTTTGSCEPRSTSRAAASRKWGCTTWSRSPASSAPCS